MISSYGAVLIATVTASAINVINVNLSRLATSSVAASIVKIAQLLTQAASDHVAALINHARIILVTSVAHEGFINTVRTTLLTAVVTASLTLGKQIDAIKSLTITSVNSLTLLVDTMIQATASTVGTLDKTRLISLLATALAEAIHGPLAILKTAIRYTVLPSATILKDVQMVMTAVETPTISLVSGAALLRSYLATVTTVGMLARAITRLRTLIATPTAVAILKQAGGTLAMVLVATPILVHNFIYTNTPRRQGKNKKIQVKMRLVGGVSTVRTKRAAGTMRLQALNTIGVILLKQVAFVRTATSDAVAALSTFGPVHAIYEVALDATVSTTVVLTQTVNLVQTALVGVANSFAQAVSLSLSASVTVVTTLATLIRDLLLVAIATTLPNFTKHVSLVQTADVMPTTTLTKALPIFALAQVVVTPTLNLLVDLYMDVTSSVTAFIGLIYPRVYQVAALATVDNVGSIAKSAQLTLLAAVDNVGSIAKNFTLTLQVTQLTLGFLVRRAYTTLTAASTTSGAVNSRNVPASNQDKQEIVL